MGNFRCLLCIPAVFAGLVDKSNRCPTTLEDELPFFLELDTTTHNKIAAKSFWDLNVHE